MSGGLRHDETSVVSLLYIDVIKASVYGSLHIKLK